MSLRLIGFISAFFIFLLSVFTVIYKVTHKDYLESHVKMFPYFNDIKYQVNRIEIRLPNERMILLIRDDKKWFIKSADNFPASIDMIEQLYEHIEELTLIADRTKKSSHFGRIGLLNPEDSDNSKNIYGIRYTLYINDKQSVADFIIGQKLKSYISKRDVRLFVRYGSSGGAFLAESQSDFQFKMKHFISNHFGMPKFNEIMSAQLMMKNRIALSLKRVISKENAQNDIFIPTSIPIGQRLIYPQVMHDYMKAFIEDLKPINAVNLSLEKGSFDDIIMQLTLTSGRKVYISFWHTDENYYMRIRRSDLVSPHTIFLYQINQSDFQNLIQPLEKFLVDKAG